VSVVERLSFAQARRVALAAQGFADPAATTRVGHRLLNRMLSRTSVLQIDSVNVFERAHYMPLFSRAGPYDKSLLDDHAFARRRLFEYWGHEASLLPVELHPHFRWRMERAANGVEGWGGVKRIAKEHPRFVAKVLQEVRLRGPVSAGDLSDSSSSSSGGWWGWASAAPSSDGAEVGYDRGATKVAPPLPLGRTPVPPSRSNQSRTSVHKPYGRRAKARCRPASALLERGPMPADLPYMPSVTNVGPILDRVISAATPPRFTHEFLKANLGFGSSNDRAFIKVLKQLGFIGPDGIPTPRYNEYRGPQGKRAIAAGLREGWAPLFLSDESIHSKSGQELLGVVKNTTGAGDAVAKKIASTFKALADRAEWSSRSTPTASVVEPTHAADEPEAEPSAPVPAAAAGSGSLRLHHDIHLHLPPTSDVGVYRAIFQAMKSELLD
jgi:hypothetical protein